MNLKAWVAELVGTFGFVFLAVGSMTQFRGSEPLSMLSVSLAHGIALASIISATMAVSGGHINPAVSIGAWLSNRLSFGNMLGYIVAQVVGAIAAVRALVMLIPSHTGSGESALPTEFSMEAIDFGTPAPQHGLQLGQTLAMEAILTFFLMLAVMGTCLDKRFAKAGGLFVGLTVFVGGLAGGAYTGACMNPARYFGSAVNNGVYDNMVLYTAGPILGAALAALAYQFLFGGREGTEQAVAE